MQEIWKPVLNYEEHYEVSSLGRIRTKERIVQRNTKNYKKHTLIVKSKIRKLQICKNGYVRTNLCKNGKAKYFYVHQLSLSSFIGKKQIGFDCYHKDKNRQNNNINNLRYITIKENRGHIGNNFGAKK